MGKSEKLISSVFPFLQEIRRDLLEVLVIQEFRKEENISLFVPFTPSSMVSDQIRYYIAYSIVNRIPYFGIITCPCNWNLNYPLIFPCFLQFVQT